MFLWWSPALSYLKLYKIGTRNSVSCHLALGRRARNGHTGVSIMQQVVVSCHNVWDMIPQWGDTQKNGIISHHCIQTSWHNEWFLMVALNLSSNKESEYPDHVGLQNPWIMYNVSIYMYSCYLKVKGTLWNTLRLPYHKIADLQNWGKISRTFSSFHNILLPVVRF